jgi:hypothetical protein
MHDQDLATAQVQQQQQECMSLSPLQVHSLLLRSYKHVCYGV